MLHKKTSEPWVTTTASIYAPKKQRLPSEILEGDRKFQCCDVLLYMDSVIWIWTCSDSSMSISIAFPSIHI